MIKKPIFEIKNKKLNNKLKIAVVKSCYYPQYVDSMVNECINSLITAGVIQKNIKTFEAPGTWEIPLLVKKIAISKKFDGIAVFGVVIKGETYHFEIIANEAGSSLMDIALQYNIPVAFEILAVFSLEQAKKRSEGKYNKGVEAANALLKTVGELQKI